MQRTPGRSDSFHQMQDFLLTPQQFSDDTDVHIVPSFVLGSVLHLFAIIALGGCLLALPLVDSLTEECSGMRCGIAMQGERYFNGTGLFIRAWLGFALALTIGNLGHVIPKSFSIMQNQRKWDSIGFVGAAPWQQAREQYFFAMNPKRDVFFDVLNGGPHCKRDVSQSVGESNATHETGYLLEQDPEQPPVDGEPPPSTAVQAPRTVSPSPLASASSTSAPSIPRTRGLKRLDLDNLERPPSQNNADEVGGAESSAAAKGTALSRMLLWPGQRSETDSQSSARAIERCSGRKNDSELAYLRPWGLPVAGHSASSSWPSQNSAPVQNDQRKMSPEPVLPPLSLQHMHQASGAEPPLQPKKMSRQQSEQELSFRQEARQSQQSQQRVEPPVEQLQKQQQRKRMRSPQQGSSDPQGIHELRQSADMRELCQPRSSPHDDFAAIEILDRNGLSEDALKEVFHDRVGITRLGKVVTVTGKMILNMVFMYGNAAGLPARHPEVPLNELSYYIVSFECPVLTMQFLFLCCKMCSFVVKRSAGHDIRGWEASIAEGITSVSVWSALKLLQYASPARLEEAFERKKKENEEFGWPKISTAVGIWFGLCTGLLGCLGVGALLLKVQNLRFIADKTYDRYSLSEWIQLGGFTSNVLSIYDVPQIELDALINLLIQDKEISLMSGRAHIRYHAWKKHLSDRLARRLGEMKSFAIMMTISVHDVKRLLVKQDKGMPQFLHDMIMRPTGGAERNSVSQSRLAPLMNRRRRLAKAYMRDHPKLAPIGHAVETCALCQSVEELEDGEETLSEATSSSDHYRYHGANRHAESQAALGMSLANACCHLV